MKLNLPTGGPLYVIVEYCQHGNLRDFLRSHDSRNEGYERPNSERLVISERTLVSFARTRLYTKAYEEKIWKFENRKKEKCISS